LKRDCRKSASASFAALASFFWRFCSSTALAPPYTRKIRKAATFNVELGVGKHAERRCVGYNFSYLDILVHDSVLHFLAVLLHDFGLVLVFEAESEVFHHLGLLFLLGFLRFLLAFASHFVN